MNEKLEKMRNGKGFIAALDQSGGSTPKALKLYGVNEDQYSNETEMYDLIHKMRSRIIKFIGDKIVAISTGQFKTATISIMWLSSIFTSIVGNVANAATFSKIIKTVVPSFEHLPNVKVFWWALSFGSCLGGSITMIGSATNVVAVATSSKAGCKVDFIKFFKFGSKIAILNLLAATAYLYFRYL